MNILFVVHYFLPRHQAGTEVYTAGLAKKLRESGHHVSVFTSEDRPGGGFELVEDEWNGIPVFRLMRGEPEDFEKTYSDERIDRIFREFLSQRRPEAVHFQHAFRLSAGMIAECAKAGVPAVVTLADFWFICPPILLLMPGFELCPGPEPELCARCGNAVGALYSGAPGSSLSASRSPALRAAGYFVNQAGERAVRAAHAIKRSMPRPLADRARAWKRGREEADPESSFRARKALIEGRRERMKKALSSASLVIAPSRFMREMTVRAGAIEPGRIIHSDYGFDHAPFEKVREEREPGPFRFGFIGTPVEHKGLHVLVEAMNALRDTGAELHIYGDLSIFPAYARRVKRINKNRRTRFRGRFEHEDAAKILSRIDALVVPSLWYENSPLTIHEAFMAKTPVITSDIGGMAELTERGGGLTFRAGAPRDLARVMRELLDDPARLDELAASVPAVKTMEENAVELLSIYSSAKSPP